MLYNILLAIFFFKQHAMTFPMLQAWRHSSVIGQLSLNKGADTD